MYRRFSYLFIMSITIELNKKQLDQKLKIHYFPAKIDGEGETNADDYFNNYTKHEHGCLSNALRGFPLQGEVSTVPDNFKAVVLQETNKPLDEDADRKLRITGCFEDFTYWNYDKIPTKADPYKQVLHILDISSELSKPISEAEVQAEIKAKKEKNSAKENC
ncbi:uncharacterized protein LOC119680381 [Teleopsis dalmanni]|uniref:uncharacterized protein LOC119677489 n=1 Tax=Teleopsis dalmanni TaxID=139649 RepID=UPI0018CF8490|nr:uncharacterized protein LOC119677489 [Teleopsis dalmanni]XP_037949096.1 uncharacterized protein LOC119680381 [Teleopsis dalmanni]